jgi:integrase
MVPKRDLTDRALKALKPAAPGKRYFAWDAQVPGFGVRVTDRGSASFVLVARYPGATNPAPRQIGAYPAIELAKARQMAREWREDIAKGIDPKDKAEAAKRDVEAAKIQAERQRANTFAAAFDAFAQEHLSTLRTGDVVKGVVEKHVMPVFGKRPLAEITRAEGNDLLRTLVKKIPTGANRVRSYLRAFGAWAEDDGRIKDGDSPFANLKRLTKERARDRVLDDLEIRSIWRACADMGAFGRAVRFMLTTGQRRSEVGDMEWRELDIAKKLWTLPRERTKADRAHEVPLSALALSILTETPRLGPHVFTTRAPRRPEEGQGKPSATAPISGWSKFKDRLDRLALAELKRLAGDDAMLPEWHLHDLRRTAATQMARLGVDRVIISKVLNHAEGGVTKVYDRSRYEAERRAALDAWARRLEAIVDGGAASNIVEFASARGVP